jgi:imidazolonepropionase-like amidohydrolase
MPRTRKLINIAAIGAAIAAAHSACGTGTDSAVAVVRNVRVFDGHQLLPGAMSVAFENGTFAHVGPTVVMADDTSAIDGEGRIIIPGLIDTHMHAGDGELALEQQLAFGVTTSVGMYDDPGVARLLRVEVETRSAFRSAGLGATVPGGHGTEYGGAVPTLSEPGQAQNFVDARLAEGSDFLKIILGPARMPILSEETVSALVVAAHRRRLLAVAHVDRLSEARLAVRAGVDALVHVFCDEVADEAFLTELVTKDVFVIPTLTIRQAAKVGAEWQGNGRALVENAAMLPFLAKDVRQQLTESNTGDERWRSVAMENVARLHAAGVTILAGSDALNPGTTWGASLHQELQLLVSAGLSPVAALRSATADAASRFGFRDRGRIAVGTRADFVLLDCDPLQDIACTTRISSVWRRGVRVQRERLVRGGD